MAVWIKIRQNLKSGKPLLDTYINLDTVTQIEYNHANDHYMLSLSDSEDKVVVLREYKGAYQRIKSYVARIDADTDIDDGISL